MAASNRGRLRDGRKQQAQQQCFHDGKDRVLLLNFHLSVYLSPELL